MWLLELALNHRFTRISCQVSCVKMGWGKIRRDFRPHDIFLQGVEIDILIFALLEVFKAYVSRIAQFLFLRKWSFNDFIRAFVRNLFRINRPFLVDRLFRTGLAVVYKHLIILLSGSIEAIPIRILSLNLDIFEIQGMFGLNLIFLRYKKTLVILKIQSWVFAGIVIFF